MIQFRTGPHMGIPYEQARACGLSSALKGREAYEKYADSVKPSTPSERLLRAVKPVVFDLETFPPMPGHWGANAIHSLDAAMLNSWKGARPMRAEDTLQFYGVRVGKGKSVAAQYWQALCEGFDVEAFDAGLFSLLAYGTTRVAHPHTSVLKPARKEKPE